MLWIVNSTNRRAVRALLSPERARDAGTDRQVATIVGNVRRHGDVELVRYARQFDRLDGPVEVSRDEMIAAARRVPAPVRDAIRTAARNIRAVAKRQVPRGWRARVAPGVTVEQRVVPLDRVGCYVPGGRYPLPSSLLMTAIPAAAAGVADVIAVCPRPEAHRRWPRLSKQACRACSASAGRMRLRRSRTEPPAFRASTRSSVQWKPLRRRGEGDRL